MGVNDFCVMEKITEIFNKVPGLSEIPEPEKQWHGWKEIDWYIAGVRIRTSRHTMGRIFAIATADGCDGQVAVYASRHKSAVRALIKYCIEIVHAHRARRLGLFPPGGEG